MTMDFKLLLPILILQAIFFIYCVSIIVKNPVKFIPKWAWGILCLNAIGCIAFLILGRDEE
ncbi:hypothetical protein UT300007_04720 [Clostridium sp. CTA-7]